MPLVKVPDPDGQSRSFYRVCELLRDAYTRADIEAAEAAHREHVEHFPGDWGREFCHGFHYTTAALDIREAESKALGLSAEEHEERERFLKHLSNSPVLDIINDPSAPRVFAQQRRLLEAWMKRFPDDSLAREYLRIINRDSELRRSVWGEESVDEEPGR